MQIMEIRRLALGASLEGLQRGGGPYVGYLKEPVEFYPAGFFPVGHADDHGTFYAIPQIAYAFNLPIESAINVFYYGAIGISALVGILGCMLYFRSWTARAVAAAWLAGLTWTMATHCDVYLIAPCAVMACTPWILWAAQRTLRPTAFLSGGLSLGLVMAVANLMRAHTGTAVLLLAIPAVGFAAQYSRRLRLGFFALTALGVGGVSLYQSHLMYRADTYVRQHSPENISSRTTSHLFWHSLYIGLGFLPNTHGIEYKDTVAIKIAERLAPEAEYLSREYDRVIRDQFLDLYRRHPTFVWQAWFAKLGVVALMFLVHANVGMAAVWFSGLPRRVLAGFVAASALSALPGILVMPYEVYLLGMWAWATLLAVVSVGATLDRWKPGDLIPARFAQWWPLGTNKLGRWGQPALRGATIAVATWYCYENIAGLRAAINTEVIATNNRVQRDLVRKLISSGQLEIAQSKQLTLIDWQPSTKDVRLATVDGTVNLTTDRAQYGYQLESTVELSGDGTVFVDYEIEIESGGVLIGILNDAGQWVETAQCVGAKMHKGRIGAHTPEGKHIRVVIANHRETGPASSQCRLAKVIVNQYGAAATAKNEVVARDPVRR